MICKVYYFKFFKIFKINFTNNGKSFYSCYEPFNCDNLLIPRQKMIIYTLTISIYSTKCFYPLWIVEEQIRFESLSILPYSHLSLFLVPKTSKGHLFCRQMKKQIGTVDGRGVSRNPVSEFDRVH